MNIKYKYVGLVTTLTLFITGCASFKPKEVGLLDGKLRDCPPAPKCVSSYYERGIHHIEPLIYSGSRDTAYSKLISVISGIEGSAIIIRKPNYIHTQFTLKPIKWVDNAEFLFANEGKIIHYSLTPSSKIGFWDWGENRRRAKRIKKLFESP